MPTGEMAARIGRSTGRDPRSVPGPRGRRADDERRDRAGHRLRLVLPADALVARTLEITGLDTVLDIVRDLHAALDPSG